MLLNIADSNFFQTRALEFILAGDLKGAGEMIVLAHESQVNKN